MANYTRSRARIYRDEPEDRGGYYQRGNGRSYLLFIVAAIVVVILAIAIVFMLKSCSEGASTLPQDTQTDSGLWTDTPTDDGSTMNPDESATPDASATIEAGESASSEASASPAAEESASATPTATSTSGSSSSGDGSAITPAEITGKPDVDEYLTLRSSASSTASKVAEIGKDEEFTILQVSTNKAWLKVKYSDKTGYVMAKYVTIGSDSDNKICTVTSETLNVRSGAGTSKDIIGTLKSGDTVIVTSTVTASGEKWYKIVTGDTEGYIFANNCRLAS
jgi:hypothetical protein